MCREMLKFLCVVALVPALGCASRGGDDDYGTDLLQITPINAGEMRFEYVVDGEYTCSTDFFGSDRSDAAVEAIHYTGEYYLYFNVQLTLDPDSSCFADGFLDYDDWAEQSGVPTSSVLTFLFVPDGLNPATLDYWDTSDGLWQPFARALILSGGDFEGSTQIEDSDGVEVWRVIELHW